MTSPKHKETPLIGRDIPWKAIEVAMYKITHFTPIATIEAGKIKALSKMRPYALLSVESPEFPQELPKEASMPVSNKVDFLNLWEVFQQRGVSPDEEVLVARVPFYGNWLLKLFLSPFMPWLHIYIFPKGHLEEACDPNFRPVNVREWFKPIAEFRPKNWRLSTSLARRIQRGQRGGGGY